LANTLEAEPTAHAARTIEMDAQHAVLDSDMMNTHVNDTMYQLIRVGIQAEKGSFASTVSI
jgi:hypothetical protein